MAQVPYVTIPLNVHFTGLSADTFNPGAGTIGDSAIQNNAAISYSKIEQLFQRTHGQQATSASAPITAFDQMGVIHHVVGATGTVLSVQAGSIASAIGNSTVTVDIKKNGTTILSAPITLDNANTAYIPESGTVSVTPLVAGDILTFHIDATVGSGTLPTGVFLTVRLKEAAS